MAGPVACLASRLRPYSRTAPASLRRIAGAWRPSLAAIVLLGLASGGCSMSHRLGSIFGSDGVDAKAEATGSIAAKPTSGLPPEEDLAFARTAITEVLTGNRKDVSAPWENPSTGARGSVTPIASAYIEDGHTCRDFLASYVRSGSETWMRGEACRANAGKWEVKTLRPWKRS